MFAYIQNANALPVSVHILNPVTVEHIIDWTAGDILGSTGRPARTFSARGPLDSPIRGWVIFNDEVILGGTIFDEPRYLKEDETISTTPRFLPID